MGWKGLTDTVQYRFVAALSFHSFSFLASLFLSQVFDIRCSFDVRWKEWNVVLDHRNFFLSFFLVTIVRRKAISAFMSSVRSSKIHHRIPSHGQMRHADPGSLPSPVYSPYRIR